MPTLRHMQRGLSLIEVLVAIVILSLGILGMAGLQASSLRSGQSSLYRSQAALLAENMAERMRANVGEARQYPLTMNADAPSGTEIRNVDRANWLAALATTLPAGDGSIAILGSHVTITVQWNDGRAARTGEPTTATYTLTTRLWNN